MSGSGFLGVFRLKRDDEIEAKFEVGFPGLKKEKDSVSE